MRQIVCRRVCLSRKIVRLLRKKYLLMLFIMLNITIYVNSNFLFVMRFRTSALIQDYNK